MVLELNFSSLAWFSFSSAVNSCYQLLTADDSCYEKKLNGIFIYPLKLIFVPNFSSLGCLGAWPESVTAHGSRQAKLKLLRFSWAGAFAWVEQFWLKVKLRTLIGWERWRYTKHFFQFIPYFKRFHKGPVSVTGFSEWNKWGEGGFNRYEGLVVSPSATPNCVLYNWTLWINRHNLLFILYLRHLLEGRKMFQK